MRLYQRHLLANQGVLDVCTFWEIVKTGGPLSAPPHPLHPPTFVKMKKIKYSNSV